MIRPPEFAARPLVRHLSVLVLGVLVLSMPACVRGGGHGSASSPLVALEKTTPIFAFHGSGAGDNFGASVSDAGDVNRDGYADIIVGAALNDTAGIDAGSARVLSGKTGQILYIFHGDTKSDNFGASVSGAGDVNRDGYADLIVGAVMDDKNGINSGSAFLFSGKDGGTLFIFTGDATNDRFGNAVSSAGDVNGDGFADVIVGAWLNDTNGEDAGMARVYSGKDYSTLYTFLGDSAWDNFGHAVCGVGDVNRDGYDDVMVGAWKDDNTGKDSGSATVYSGQNGSILFRFNGNSAEDVFGNSVSGAGDVNRDGHPDIIVGARWDGTNGATSGSAYVFSGKDGGVIHTFMGDARADNLGVSVSGIGDVNGDGHDDVVVGAHGDDNNGNGSGHARVYSGKDGAILFGHDGDAADDNFGHAVSGAGDVNRDGVPDFIVGAWWDDDNGPGSGSATIFSGARLGLSSKTYMLALSSTDSQVFALNAGAEHGGKDYHLLGTLAGTEPGLTLGNHVLPLNLDGYFFFTYLNPNAPPLTDSRGKLDLAGKASAKFTVFTGMPAWLIGLPMHHAYAVITPSVEYTSNPVSVVFTP